MCIVNPHETYKIETTYRNQIYDFCGTYSLAPYKHPDSASSGVYKDWILLIPVYAYIYIYIVFSCMWNYRYFTIMSLYIVMDAVCLQGINGSRARVVFIQIVKCAYRRACTKGYAGVMFEMLSLLCLF